MTLKLENITAGYVANHPVIRDVSLEVTRGKILSVLGPSGSGKSTLLRVVAGLHPALSGSVSLDGRDVTRLPAEKRRIALVPQEGALFPQLSVASNIGYGLQGNGYGSVRTRSERQKRVSELLDLIDMRELADRMPQQLSGGQQQRVALARALAPRPDAVLLDEPFSSLDARLRLEVRSQVVELLRQANVPAILITHDQDEALGVSDTIAVLNSGIVEQVGTPREVYLTPSSSFVAHATGDCTVLDAQTLGLGTGVVAIRPEQFVVERWTEDLASSDRYGNPIVWSEGSVLDVTFGGKEYLVKVQLSSGPEVAVEVSQEDQLNKGDQIRVGVIGNVHVLG